MSCGKIEDIRKLLRNRQHLVNSEKQPPLHLACQCGHLDIVDVLVNDFDADINAVDRRGNTPLSLVAGGGHVQIVVHISTCCNTYFWEEI